MDYVGEIGPTLLITENDNDNETKQDPNDV